ncbi:monodechloroaminopyrrolnitrin synthase PrnB family protein [Kutzneria chonburiensis]|uniref:Monodechloroaminopyrrolnitrin synthase PrnB family protein n=1 Tax=Kutzneria chonburiensis TaxID=1483604 RepID=A0ABV6MS96_9PSEU|nr:monodechloroaminopyrrolnitrin synthase PrnB family protein [Kutzneria chonburiensis]
MILDLERWIRGEFTEINTALEEIYFAEQAIVLSERSDVDDLTRRLVRDGETLIGRVAQRRELPAGPDARYELLGLVGFYLGACRRHEVEPDQARVAPLAMALSSSLGVAPRFSSAHQHIHNRAVDGAFYTFTTLDSERIFLTYNGLAVIAYRRAANALLSIPRLGVSNPLAAYHFADAVAALGDVLRHSRKLADELDRDRFFYNIRPYFKSHRVGSAEYRGANAGDFAAINAIDVLLGLCSPHDPFYQWVTTDKYPYVAPEDQRLLRSLVTTESLLDMMVRELEGPLSPSLRENAELFLEACRQHGAATVFHHNRLVLPFLAEPAADAPSRPDLTASGPPLEVVIETLARLRDLRAARPRPGLDTARPALDRVRELLER